MIILRGTVEVRATDGAVRVFGLGTVVRLEDTTVGRPRDARLAGRGLGRVRRRDRVVPTSPGAVGLSTDGCGRPPVPGQSPPAQVKAAGELVGSHVRVGRCAAKFVLHLSDKPRLAGLVAAFSLERFAGPSARQLHVFTKRGEMAVD